MDGKEHVKHRCCRKISIILFVQAGLASALVQVIPQGIVSVNGSSTTMGCTSPLVERDGVEVCRSQSYLVDGCSPDINTSSPDWASQLVTVKKVPYNNRFLFAHVLLTLGFETPTSVGKIEVDLFLCSEFNIGAPYITVYLNSKFQYNLTSTSGLYFFNEDVPFSSNSSCDSLTTLTMSGDVLLVSPYHMFHFLMTFHGAPSAEWVHLGEIRFLDRSGNPIHHLGI